MKYTGWYQNDFGVQGYGGRLVAALQRLAVALVHLRAPLGVPAAVDKGVDVTAILSFLTPPCMFVFVSSV